MYCASVTQPRQQPAARRGVAAVEFALVAPLLALFVLGMFEMGRALMVKETLSIAARKACRTAILPAKDNAAVIADAKAVLTENGINATNAVVTIQVNGATSDVKSAKAGDRISVRVSIPFSRVSWTTSLFLSGQDVTSETLTMQKQA